MTATRREKNRAATLAEIKAAALDQIASEGAGALTLRGIARAIGMSPAGLYRYYDGLDALITELITDAYNDLADAVNALAGQRSLMGIDRVNRISGKLPKLSDFLVADASRLTAQFEDGREVPGHRGNDRLLNES